MNDYIKTVLETFQMLCRVFGEDKAPGMMRQIEKRRKRNMHLRDSFYDARLRSRIVQRAQEKAMRPFKAQLAEQMKNDPVGVGMAIAIHLTTDSQEHVTKVVI